MRKIPVPVARSLAQAEQSVPARVPSRNLGGFATLWSGKAMGRGAGDVRVRRRGTHVIALCAPGRSH